MTIHFTLDDLVRFLYDEVTFEEEIAIREALDTNWELQEEYQALKEAYNQLPKASFSPDDTSITNILRYSKTASLPTLV
jgi:hypothetical protein